MTLLARCAVLAYTFFKIGLFGFGGGYAMMSMIMAESAKLSITMAQLADLNALDLVVPGPIAINSATYVGYLYGGFWGALAATLAVMLPSFLLVALVMRFIDKYRGNTVMEGFLYGVKPAAVGLIAYAALALTAGLLLVPGGDWANLFANPLATVSPLMLLVFAAVAVANIGFHVNPILLTLLAGVLGAVVGG
ncbi:MAG: chromate transporter [Oscillospiraceae bacterium]|jgi:chromate transporter|nr:chromate transporter [Oscillospiraceae bacterium]